MAKDLMRMLTEITPTQQPVAGTPNFRGMFGQQQAQRLQGSLGSLARGGVPSPQARMGQALAGLDLNKPEDLAKLAKIQQGTGDLAGAAQTAAKIKALRSEEAQATAGTTQRQQFASYLDKTYPNKGYGALALQGMITPANMKNFIKEAPSGQTDPALVKEYRFALSTGYTGTFQEYIQSKKSPLVSTVATPQQKKLEGNLERQETMYDLTSEAAPANILKGQNARKVLKTVNDGIATGAFPEFVANQSAAFQGVLQKFGIPVPQGLASNVLQQSELKKIQVDGMLPFIAEQGRGWTDADRENYFKTSAGFTQPWQYNEVVALTDLQNAVDGLDKNQFAYARAKLDTVTDLDGDTLYADYLKHLPRTKVITDFKRGDLTYDKLEVIEDGANLSQYWVESIPTGFTLEKPDGELIDVSWEDINATALDRGQTAREFLAEQELKGSIKKAL